MSSGNSCKSDARLMGSEPEGGKKQQTPHADRGRRKPHGVMQGPGTEARRKPIAQKTDDERT
jgi:hypothetical protein